MGWYEVFTVRESDTSAMKPATTLVLVMLASRLHNGDPHRIAAATLATDCGIDVRTVHRSLNDLVERGLVEVKRTIRSNLYRLNLQALVSVDVVAEGQDVPLCRGAGCPPGEGQDVHLEKGRMSPSPKGSPEKVNEKVSTESAGEGLDIRALEQAVLDCLPPRKRGMMLDRASAGILAAMAEKHGVEACLAAAGECGGADRPAYMLRARLEHPTRGKGGRSRLPDAARISENWGATEEQKLPWRTTLPGAHAGPSDDPELDRLFGIETKDGMK